VVHLKIIFIDYFNYQ